MRKQENIALFLFIVSLIAGDNFYESLRLSQSYLLVPLLILYLLGGTFLPRIKTLRIFGLIFISIITLQLLIFVFDGLTEWYRTTGGVVLTFMLVVIFSENNICKKQLKWLFLCSAVPILAFYLGFWDFDSSEGTELRMTFLKHDPNHLAHLIIYGIIGLLVLDEIQVLKFRMNLNNKRSRIFLILIFTIPLTMTVSRTAIIAFFAVIAIYLIQIYQIKKIIPTILSISIILIIISLTYPKLFINNETVNNFAERFKEKDESREIFYSTGLNLILDNFFLGVGIKQFRDYNWRIKNGFFRREFIGNNLYYQSTAIHNGFIDIFLIGGIAMFVSFIIIICYPAIFIFSFAKRNRGVPLAEHKFLIYSFTLTFILLNLTYSLYNTKLGWWGIAFSYLLIAPYYNLQSHRKTLNLSNLYSNIKNEEN